MRTSSILSRSVIAVASLAIGSAALAAAPATAATPPDVTRAMVLAATADLRAFTADETDYYVPLASRRIINRLIAGGCNFELDGENRISDVQFETIEPGQVDGVLIHAWLQEATEVEGGEIQYADRGCSIAALATTDAAFALSGTSSLTATFQKEGIDAPVTLSSTSTLSGDRFVVAPINAPADSWITNLSFSASGNATRPYSVTTQEKVATPKSAAAKKAAKKAYAKKLKAAKKAYSKALDKAGKSKSKKAAAKKTYAAKKAAAKSAYDKAVATFKIVTVRTPQAENRPFTVNAIIDSFAS